MLRAFGKTFGQVRRTAREFQSTFNDALREAERQANLEDVRKDIDSVRSMDPTKDLRKGLDDTKRQLSGKIDGGRKDGAKPPKSDGTAPAKSAEPASAASRTLPAAPASATETTASDTRTAETPPADAAVPADDPAPRPAAVGSER